MNRIVPSLKVVLEIASVAAILLLFLGQNAEASIQTFTNQASFATATNSLSFSAQDFSSVPTGLLTKNTAHNFGAFTASATDVPGNDMFFYVANGFGGAEHAPFTTSKHLGWGERSPIPASPNGFGQFGPTITIQFNSPQNAVSFQFLDSDSTDEYRLSVDGDAVNNFPATITSNDSAFFFGVVDTMNPFSTLTFSTPTTSPGGFVEEFGIDDIQFAAIPTSGNVPEPTALLVWGGLACCAVAVKRRR